MNKPNLPLTELIANTDEYRLCQARLHDVLAVHDLGKQKADIQRIADELGRSVLDCAAALLYLQDKERMPYTKPAQQAQVQIDSQASINAARPLPFAPVMKPVRYRLNVGSKDQLSLAELKKVIVEESGVDINNIHNIRILDTFTLVDLPDGMPQEIFHHLKFVEINGKKLDIRRIKARSKQHGRIKHRPRRNLQVS